MFRVKRLMKTMKIMKRKQICEEMEGILEVNEIFASNTIYHNISMVKNKRNLYSFIPFFVLSPEKRNYHTNLSTIHLYDTFLTLHMFVKRSFSTRFFNSSPILPITIITKIINIFQIYISVNNEGTKILVFR